MFTWFNKKPTELARQTAELAYQPMAHNRPTIMKPKLMPFWQVGSFCIKCNNGFMKKREVCAHCGAENLPTFRYSRDPDAEGWSFITLDKVAATAENVRYVGDDA